MEHDQDIASAREMQTLTRRPTVAAMEDLLYVPRTVLDHGFVRVVDYMGDDGAVVQAARVSYGRGTRAVSEDRGLIRYLMRHWHSTPFEMCEIKLHVKLPIFVARQWIRHRTANVNEYSGRYSVLDREFYIPSRENLAAQSTGNRQGRGGILPEHQAQEVMRLLQEDAEHNYERYIWLLNEGEGKDHDGADAERMGLSRELARIGLGLNTYTQWYWKVDLHNLLGFLRLRADPHAQYEIRAYAEVILEMVSQWVPLTHEAFLEYRLGAVSLSATAAGLVRRALMGERIDFETSGLARREWDDLVATFDLSTSACEPRS